MAGQSLFLTLFLCVNLFYAVFGSDCGCDSSEEIATKCSNDVECDCGYGTLECCYMHGEKRCVCMKGYALNKDICEECDCGHGVSECSFVNDTKYCTCRSGYTLNDGVCKECDCGPHSDSCQMIGPIKFCTCISGYTFNPLEGNCEKLKLPYGALSALASIMYFSVIGFVLGLINSGFLIMLCYKRCRDKKRDEAQTRLIENI
ncbi:protein kinase C-binding protein NELL1-like isoform X1 [Parasteatoda tepidariorum]|uniref:protein kinase C-binding protein NELL1-like isoform X1 n=1 Tax=Parasteatoda tepidariorum TaxID=114398 RepID=UPI001C71E40B|nr:matrilin-3-like [Parasteatoda tepidariorum]XP_042910618.1 matrilin-3-like [Parasteatoda tepidariorum]